VSAIVIIVVALVFLAAGIGLGYWLPPHGRRPSRDRPKPVKRILLPFTGSSISKRAFDAAVRLASAENATIVPAFLARVPRYLPIESPVPAQCSDGMTLLEAIEQKAEAQGLSVDARVERGRSYRDALRRLLAEEHFDRVIVSATDSPRVGLSGEDLEWLLERVPAEVMILRPAPDDKREISATAASVNGHF
jgi:nucleotide-binding universal stress UspA family protein